MRKLILAILATLSIPAHAYTDQELECLALNIYHEARNQELQGQLAVGLVTLNRVKNNRWPDTICGVVWQRKQFSWTHDGKPDRPYNKPVWEQIRSLARMLLNARDVYPDFTKGALYYHAKYVKPVWRHQLVEVAEIGSHVFYR